MGEVSGCPDGGSSQPLGREPRFEKVEHLDFGCFVVIHGLTTRSRPGREGIEGGRPVVQIFLLLADGVVIEGSGARGRSRVARRVLQAGAGDRRPALARSCKRPVCLGIVRLDRQDLFQHP